MKKNILYVLCAVVIIALLTAMLVFIFSGDHDTYESKTVELSGTWELVAVVQNDQPIFIENEFMIFTDSNADNYKNKSKEPYISSAYEISDGTKLILSDISKEYIIDKKTDNIMRLYESKDKYMLLIRFPNADMSDVSINNSVIYGKWKVIYKNAFDEQLFDEVLEFTADSLNDYRNGSTEPVATSSFSWDGAKYLNADKWGTKFEFHPLANDRIIFVEVESGIVWELEKLDD